MIRSRVDRLIKRMERPYEVHNRIEVSRSALLHNVDFFQTTTKKQVIPVLKGNAYGHGIEQVATALKNRKFPYIAVDGYFEALRVQSFKPGPILVMGMIKPQNFSKLRLHGLTFVVQDKETIKALGKLRKKVKIHLELNTGMNRYGIRPSELDEYLQLIQSFPKLQLEGVMSHLADADGTSKQTVNDAVRQFDDCIDAIVAAGFKPTIFHIGQSAGSTRAQSRYANAVRIGLSLYGINPFPPKHPSYKMYTKLHPAMRLISTITKEQVLESGDKVSYNYTYTAPKAMKIGVLPLGYFEGVKRELSNTGTVLLGKKALPIVGRVCMNHTMIGLPGAQNYTGKEVIVYSDHAQDSNSVESMAREYGLFSYSILTGLSPDVRRYLVE